MSKPQVGIIVGSKSDLDIVGKAAEVLESFGVEYELRIMSAHRTPDLTHGYATTAAGRGVKVIIAAAGLSAHLAGVVTSLTTLPVLSIPVKRADHGHEALWSNISMPPGIPLATMPENGAKNAALFAIEILAISSPELTAKYQAFRQKQHDEVVAADAKVQESGWKSQI
jgi:5-(carboxyamino)imidazole ribonucleotide mutase